MRYERPIFIAGILPSCSSLYPVLVLIRRASHISLSLMCRWFRVAVLPLDGELATALLYRGSRKRCAVCGAAFVPKSNRGKYCPDCAARVRRRKEAERQRKRYHLSTHLGAVKPL